MSELEKVIAILETCIQDDCDNCPISLENKHCAPFVELPKITVMDAIALLKAHIPRVMMIEEVVESEDWMWIEYTSGYCEWCRQIDILKHANIIVWNDESVETLDDYDQRWRCWTSRPMPEQMANTPWKGDSNGGEVR